MIVLLALVGCRLPDLTNRDGDSATYGVDCDDLDSGLGRRCPSRCEGGWGFVLDEAPNADLRTPEAGDPIVLHVLDGAAASEDRDPADDGALLQPFPDLDLALRRAEEIGGPVVLALGPGTYTTRRVLYRESEVGTPGPIIVGCSPDEVVVVPQQPDQPVFTVRGQDLDPADGNDAKWALRIRGLTVRGGRRAIRAIGSVDLAVQDVRVEQSQYYGIQAWGRQVSLELTDVEVRDTLGYTAPFVGAIELGVGVGALSGAAVEASRLTVEGAIGAGVVLLGDTRPDAVQRISATTVRDVEPSADRLGRGLVADGLMDLTVDGLTVERVHDAGIWVRNAGAVDLRNLGIDDVQPALPPNGPADGVVLIQDAFAVGPGSFLYALGEASVTAPGRATVVASGSLTVDLGQANDTLVIGSDVVVTGENANVDPAPPAFDLDLEAFPDDPPN